MESVVLISGGTSGIGLELVRWFHRRRFKVATFGRSIHYTDRLREEFGEELEIGCLDLQDHKAVREFCQGVVTRWGCISILINNAAVSGPFKPLTEISEEEIIQTINIDLTSQIFLTSVVINQMVSDLKVAHLGPPRASLGVIVNVSSNAWKGMPGGSLYSAAKAGINAFSASIAQELKLYVFSFNPGHVDTRMQKAARTAPSEKFPASVFLEELNRSGKLVKPEMAAAEIGFLCLHPYRFINGSFLQPEEVLVAIESSSKL